MAKDYGETVCAAEVAEILKVSKTTAYQTIARLNEELKKKGCVTIKGRTSTAYLFKRYGL